MDEKRVPGRFLPIGQSLRAGARLRSGMTELGSIKRSAGSAAPPKIKGVGQECPTLRLRSGQAPHGQGGYSSLPNDSRCESFGQFGMAAKSGGKLAVRALLDGVQLPAVARWVERMGTNSFLRGRSATGASSP